MAQDDFLAKQYFNDGDFEKAVVFYEKLVEKNIFGERPRIGVFVCKCGINIAGVSNCSYRLEKFLDKQFPGKMHRLLQLHG